MIHLGDITKISGYEAPVVDILVGGSPCQDLSIAGKRAGLSGERSGLFMEQVRIVKEMRENDKANGRTGWAIRPRYMVWENVPGAFSSGNPTGADFQAVLEEICKIVCEEAPPVPIPEKGWSKAGCLSGVGDGGTPFSVAWRLHDAQHWGVPQRRKRIALVADFGGLSAPEILFERKGVRGDFEESEETWERTSEGAGDGAVSAISFQERAGKPGGGKGILIQRERTGALSTLNNQSVYSIQRTDEYRKSDKAHTLSARDHKGATDLVCANKQQISTVRKLTPKEYERLQGYKDEWTNIGEWKDSQGKTHKESDGPRYKALGNSIALPFWEYIARRICAQYERPMTMASLFDGIGGFPLAFERAGAKAVWASEIEEFPIAVTKIRFPETKEVE